MAELVGRTALVKNWSEFQHYRDRDPPWVKLHRKLLDDYEYQRLPLASKALAPMLWLLAASNVEGRVSVDPDYLAFRLRWPMKDIEAGLIPLIDKGFLILDSTLLAKPEQLATPEVQRKRGESEGKNNLGQQAGLGGGRFDDFWDLFPARQGTSKPNKKGCRAKWKARALDALADVILRDVELRTKHDTAWLRGFAPNPETYLNQDRWDDGFTASLPQTTPAERAAPASKADLARHRMQVAEDWAKNVRGSGSMPEVEIEAYLAEMRTKCQAIIDAEKGG